MKTLNLALRRMFRAPDAEDQHRRVREQVRRLAAQGGVCIERLQGGGMNVWPPRDCAADPYEGDHYVCFWSDALQRVRAHCAQATEATQAAQGAAASRA